MDIAKPAKLLWIVFSRKTSSGIIETLGGQWKIFNSLLAKPFDIVIVAKSVYNWNQHEAPDYDEPRLDVSKVESYIKICQAIGGSIHVSQPEGAIQDAGCWLAGGFGCVVS